MRSRLLHMEGLLRMRIPAGVLAAVAACLTIGGCDYGIKEGDNPQIIALKKMGAKVIHGIDGSYQIDLKDSSIGDDGLIHFEELPNVQSIDLSNTNVTDEGLVHLVDGPEMLGTLMLDDTDITDQGIEILKGISGLSSLSLCGTSVTNEGLAQLPENLPRLSSLRLMNCDQITNDGLKAIAELRGLELLFLTDCPQITNEGLKHLIGKKRLRMVHLVNTGCTTGGAANLANSLRSAIVVGPDGKAAGRMFQ